VEPYSPVRVHRSFGGTNNKKQAARRAMLFSFIGYVISLIIIIYIYIELN
jgi:hypothetical protein